MHERSSKETWRVVVVVVEAVIDCDDGVEEVVGRVVVADIRVGMDMDMDMDTTDMQRFERKE
jgi:hypothetical protein